MTETARYPDLDGAAVLITGGGSGIGAALVAGFAAQGAKVAFIDIAEAASRALCDRLESEIGRRPLHLGVDVRDVGELKRAVAEAQQAHGAATVLINNAALDDRHDIDAVDVDYWENNLAINLRPHFFTAQAVAPGMRAARRGSIINFTSTSYMINHPDMPAYTTAKAGIVGLTKGLAGKLGPWGIRVNAVAPGWVMTERQRAKWVTPEALAAHIDGQCIKEQMVPDDLVGPCLFLASDASRMLTAQVIVVDGGYL